VVPYADDLGAGFGPGTEAEQFLLNWKERLRGRLKLHPDKTAGSASVGAQ